MATFTVVYDACLLFPASIRDLLVELARTGLFRARWTARIHQEWINAALRSRPELPRERLERVAELMNAAIPDGMLSGFEHLEPGIVGMPDPDDRHVLAAAIYAGAQEVVTFNLRDFPIDVLRPYGVSAIHPDDFIGHLVDLNIELVCDAVRRVRRRLRNPPFSADELVSRYEHNGLAVSASILRSRIGSL